ncbi:bifunctional ADP-dependent NAD(P)H-hydrate dehydratase/NAD(P)H-hydrate epimerase [Paenibacillus wulumuqiensis]|uniref:bifunctional ADP-dependent NAD(P)H-hydrate dehydratase/NAD(P)H-hydrate epimerase n=1 Tax=Paenibacillus wulumuqiensis TaxID=1567107 RepID=UPI0006194418|nr:bifunctional ADP-dependent NAD(P)H-hydrate dehydratase/NAD(P)H-hydrate epimerase [Paenibacillus wulumuqiensis]
MYIVTAQQMRDLDQYTIEQLGIPAMSLMESAGKAIAEEVIAWCGGHQDAQADVPRGRALTNEGGIRSDEKAIPGRSRQHWLVLVGKGNNGGDGLVAARYLADAGLAVTLLYAGDPQELTGDAAAQRDAAQRSGIPHLIWNDEWNLQPQSGNNEQKTIPTSPAAANAEPTGQSPNHWTAYSGIIDALLGTGSQGEPREPYASIIRSANASGKPIIAADIPSGLNADTGEVAENCIRAKVTVCLAFLKQGLTQYPGAGAAGEVVVRSIGIPRAAARQAELRTHLITDDVLRDVLQIDTSRARAIDGHKGTYGHVMVVGGSMNMSGAGLMASRSALRIGSGLVTWALPEQLMKHMVGHVPELMMAPASQDPDGQWTADTAHTIMKQAAKADVLAIGPGLGRFEKDGEWLHTLWKETEQPWVLDADGLNILSEADGLSRWPHRKADTVLTPHPGEMARLAGVSTADIQRDRIGIAREFARKHGVVLVLKGARTIVASPHGDILVNTTGHPGMATGGSGDVLTGVISGLMAQGWSGWQAAAFGVHLHGHAGEEAARKRSGNPASLLAGDIIESL